jgi:hypothetical protein
MVDTYEVGEASRNASRSLQIGGIVPPGNIQQFRALYPEYNTGSDKAIAINSEILPNGICRNIGASQSI